MDDDDTYSIFNYFFKNAAKESLIERLAALEPYEQDQPKETQKKGSSPHETFDETADPKSTKEVAPAPTKN